MTNHMMFQKCKNCMAIKQSGYISEWQKLIFDTHIIIYLLKNVSTYCCDIKISEI